jgi:NADPH-dependent 2,4-dienoyl-CoA reductase/sulfur reductase-like enzyme
VYAIGDCAELKNPQIARKSIEPIWYTAKYQGKTAANNIVGIRTAYNPPIWYNSAKFFDLEYQTYGFVPAQIEQYPELETYSHSSQSEEKLFRLVWQKESRVLIGVNALGIRINHECVHQWLSEGKKVDEVMNILHEADFNPEFSNDFLKIFKNQFNSVYA